MPEDPEPPVRPQPPTRQGRPGRGRIAIITAAVLLVVLLMSLRGIASFYTDFIWYDSLGQSGVFTGVLRAKLTLVVLFTIGFFLLLWANLAIADKLAPAFRAPGPEEELVVRYRELVGGRTRLVRFVVAALFALTAGASPGAHWNEWILFNNSVDFGDSVDPLFGRDLSWYIFKLPFLDFLVGWLFFALVIVLIITAVAHYLNGGIRFQIPGPERVTSQVKVHLSALLAVLALVKAAGYYLQQFGLTISTRGTVNGATYTDVNAQLPAIRLLILVAVAAAALFLVNMRRKGWVLPVLGVGIWALVAVVGGAIVPAAVQRFRVQPSELSQESEFIDRNIAATRTALGLDDVDVQDYAGNAPLDSADLTDNADVIRNIRLWDTGVLRSTYGQLQALRPFYRINDVDVDRYMIDGELTQVMVSVRDLDSGGVTQPSWETVHLTYTHGYGVVMSSANSKTSLDRPELLVSDIPVRNAADVDVAVEQPAIYIGEEQGGFVVVDTNREEVDYEDDEGQRQTTAYAGADGLEIGSVFRRAAFALRFADVNLLFSGSLRDESRILINRDVRERVQALAPFLTFDADPYPVVLGGRVQWVIDGYTTTDRYPYAQAAVVDGVAGDLDRRFNYIRNSVKAVVDAYDGTTTFYVTDPEDPILRAYGRAFPGLFTYEPPPEDLRAHFRYPEDLFRVQTNMWGRYRLTDPRNFFDNLGAWAVARDPGAPVEGRIDTETTSSTSPDDAPRDANRIEPYYLLTALPGETEQSFVMLRPFTPLQGDAVPVLTGFLVADSDPDTYGQLTSYETPASAQIDGPSQVSATISSFEQIAEDQTDLCRPGSGSTCTFGNLVFVPIEQSLLYVQPLYITSEQNNLPLLRKVIVEFNGRVGYGNNLEEALTQLFPDLPDDVLTDNELPDPAEGGENGEPPPTDERTVAQLLADADTLFEEAEAALREGGSDGLAEYQDKIAEARDLIAQAQELLDGETPTSTDEQPSATTTTPPSSSTTATTAEPA
ncbi:MAG: UPF0182 family protein [Acidimicrobiia bacterium]|nr:UPF0182 family protein [Acidimicrobiia bacterium]